jgi:hypothetical protein
MINRQVVRETIHIVFACCRKAGLKDCGAISGTQGKYELIKVIEAVELRWHVDYRALIPVVDLRQHGECRSPSRYHYEAKAIYWTDWGKTEQAMTRTKRDR